MEKPTFTSGWGDAPSGYGYSLADEDLFGLPPTQSADQNAGTDEEHERPLLRGDVEHLRLSGELVRPLEPVVSLQMREARHRRRQRLRRRPASEGLWSRAARYPFIGIKVLVQYSNIEHFRMNLYGPTEVIFKILTLIL